MEERNERKDVWYQCLVIFLTVFNVLLLIFVTFVNFVGQGGFGRDTFLPGWFTGDIGEISDKFYLDATPANFAFAVVWPVIFLFQWGWVIYVLTSLCRRNQSGPVFLNPPVVSPFFLWMYGINLGLNVAWLFLWDNELLIWAYVDLILVWATLVIALIDNLRCVDRYGVDLRQHKRDLWAIRIFIQNGLAVYLTWITLASLLAMGYLMTYVGDVPQDVSSTVILSLLGAIVVGYFLLENFVFERYLRYIYSFWAVAVWALLGITIKNWSLDRNGLLALVSLIVTAILGIIKIILSIVRTKSNPLYRTEYVKGEQHVANKSYQVDY